MAAVTKPLSNRDLEHLLGSSAHVVVQNHFTTIPDLNQRNVALLLLPNGGNAVGHWVAVLRIGGGNHVEYFDPYGQGFGWEYASHHILYDNVPLSRLSGHVTKNRFPFEKMQERQGGHTISPQTCGDWTALRLQHSNLPNHDFIKFVHKEITKPGATADDAVAAFEIARL